MKPIVRTALLVTVAVLAGVVLGVAADESNITTDVIASAQRLIGLDFTPAERDSMLDDLRSYEKNYETLRTLTIPNDVAPALVFDPRPAGWQPDEDEDLPIELSKPEHTKAPANIEDVAFWSVRDLGELLRTRQITSVQLTKMYLDRLKRYSPELHCTITLTEDLAMKQARKADAEIAAGHYRGPLQGIPFGAKDLFAVAGYKTTWGAAPYKDQVIDDTATVIQKLEDAGAVLVAKLTLGALAWGDVWYGGKTRNPWNIEQGSSGSSAGPAAATAAGLVPFAIGTETWGSIVSPSTRCGTTGLRPTFGRVSRAGAMALSWSMDKVGPICRNVEDCAIVFDAIRGSDGIDKSVIDEPFNYTPKIDPSTIRIGVVEGLFDKDDHNLDHDKATLAKLRALGFQLVPVTLPKMPVEALSFILSAEAAAAFDDLTRSNRDDLMVRQVKGAWPNVFRGARFIPAVEYIQANRVRSEVMAAMQDLDVDVYITPSFGGDNLLLTNLTGHPCVVLPNGFNDKGSPTSITFMGKLFDEATLLAVAKKYQDATDFNRKHPPRYEVAKAPAH